MIETLTQENVLGKISRQTSIDFDEPDSAEMSFEDDEDDELNFQKFVK